MANGNSGTHCLFQFSLRELLVLTVFAALGLAALKFTGVAGGVLQAVSALVLMGLLIVACVDRGRRQAFAIGFVVPVVVYTIMLSLGGSKEQNFRWSRMFTTKLTGVAFESMVIRTFLNSDTGEILPEENFRNYTPGGFGIGSSVNVHESIDRGEFLLSGHILWGMLFGYLGGKFAVFVYVRRQSDDAYRSTPSP